MMLRSVATCWRREEEEEEEEEEEDLFAFNDTMDDIAQGRHLYVHTCMHLCMGRV